MNTRRKSSLFLVTASFLFISIVAFSQSKSELQASAEKTAKQMFIDTNNKNYDAVIEMTYPTLFNFVPKDQMKTLFKSMFEGNEEFTIEIPNTIPPYKVTEVIEKKEDGLAYAFITYDMKMKMTFLKQSFDEESKKMMKSVMQMQGMDVSFVSNNAVDVILNDRITILIRDKETNGQWKMVNYDTNSPFLFQVLPSNILEKSKALREELLIQRKKESEKKN